MNPSTSRSSHHHSTSLTSNLGATYLLTIGCLNLRGFKSNTDYFRSILISHDVFAISEHWLHDYDLHLLNSFNSDYVFHSVCSPSTEDSVWCRPRYLRGHGGVAIAWRKALQNVFKIDTSPSHRVVGIKVLTDSRPVCFLSVYLPSRSGCTDDFRESLDYLDSLINTLGYDCDIVILGDFNADPGPSGGPKCSTPSNEQGKILIQYLNRWNFLSTHLHLGSSLCSHTYESEAHGSFSTIDHILCQEHLLPSFHKSFVLEESVLNTSDHLPLSCSLHLSFPHVPRCKDFPAPPPRFNWRKPSADAIFSRYTVPLDQELSTLLPPADGIYDDPLIIDKVLSSITHNMKSISSRVIPIKRFQKHIVPGWNDTLRNAQKDAKLAFCAWKKAGKPRSDDPLHSAYKLSKRTFRKLLRSHRNNLKEEFFLNLDKSNSDYRKLFRDIRSFSNKSCSKSFSSSIIWNGTTYKDNSLLEGWADYFEHLSTPSPNPSYDHSFFEETNLRFHDILSSSPGDIFSFSEFDIEGALKTLKLEKASGPDGIDPEHLVYAGPLLIKLLTSIFNSIIHTCHIPSIFCSGYIIPIPKGADKDLRNPSNYRGITLLSNMAKLFEKLLLTKISEDGISLNPLQGGFKPGYSSLHTAFILQEAIQSTREINKKAFVAFLDVRKAFDTVWHEGLFVKLYNKGIHPRIWHILSNWYSNSSSCILLDGISSRNFRVLQGVRQGAILSPLLYSIYVDELLDSLVSSNLGAFIGHLHSPSPMYADDLALIASSEHNLQLLLDLTSAYACLWRYQFNTSKSAILVFGESPRSRQVARSNRSWSVGSNIIPEADTYTHLGILRSVHHSNAKQVSGRCASGRSAFYALNSVGSRFGCLHPITSFKLYKALSLPILLYGCEVLSYNKSNLAMMSRVHRKILRTIQGLPTRCPNSALNTLLGSLDVPSLILQRQICFVNSLAAMSISDFPRQVLECRLTLTSCSGIVPIWENSLLDLKLPSLHCLISKCRGKLAWKRSIKKLLLIKQHLELLDCCDRYLISSLPIKLGKPPPIWFVTLNDRSLTSTANFRARLLVGCDGLESDAARFRYRRDNRTSGDGYCKLCCCSKMEDPLHFLAICSSLESLRVSLISSAPSSVKAHLPNHTTDAEGFLNILLGIDWIVDDSTQGWIMSFIKQLRDARSNLLSNRC